MTRQDALEITRGIRISDDENSLCFKAMMIFWLGGNYGWDLKKTAKTTRYSEEDVETVLTNWRQSEILVDGKINGDFDNPEEDWMEVILISMCGAGELVRFEEKYGTEDMKLKLFNAQTGKFDKDMTPQKTLNDHLFDTLNRLSAATPETVDSEINKAASIVLVAEKVLDVARLKLDIMAAGQAAEGFKEIDALPDSTKKLTE